MKMLVKCLLIIGLCGLSACGKAEHAADADTVKTTFIIGAENRDSQCGWHA